MRSLYFKLLLIAMGFVLVLGLPQMLDRLDSGSKGSVVRKRFSRELAADVSLRRHGVYGIDFIRCGSCRIEKLKHGPFTFGGLNVLVLKDLAVVIPPREENNPESGPMTARSFAARLGMNDDFLRAQGAGLKFSGLRIERLQLSRLEGTNVVKVLSAKAGEAKGDGLHLTDCSIMNCKGADEVDLAILKHKPHLRLEWPGGELDLQ